MLRGIVHRRADLVKNDKILCFSPTFTERETWWGLARKIAIILHACGPMAQLTAGLRRIRLRRRFDQGEMRDASGLNTSPTARSPVARTVELVKPFDAQGPSSDEPRETR
jgi:hypothetical protein